MLSKLIRHEFRATVRIMLPLYLLMALTAALFNLFMHLADRYNVLALQIFRGISTFTFVVTLFGSGVVTLCLMVFRFYKNYMTDEGYLMFTLPVTTARLIWSKLIVALVWGAATVLAMILSVILGTVGQGFWRDAVPALNQFINGLRAAVSTGNLIAYALELVVLAILSGLSSYLMFYAAIALGHSMANHKVLFSVLFYIAFNVALQTITSFLSIFGIVGADRMDVFATEPDIFALLHQFSLGSILYNLLVGTAFYLITYFTLKKRLNLQ